jgi:hypothetical protein
MNSVVVLLLAGLAVGCGGSAVTSPTAPALIPPLTQGRYLLCGLPDGAAAELSASMTTARMAYVSVPPHQTTMDIEIPPAR